MTSIELCIIHIDVQCNYDNDNTDDNASCSLIIVILVPYVVNPSQSDVRLPSVMSCCPCDVTLSIRTRASRARLQWAAPQLINILLKG